MRDSHFPITIKTSAPTLEGTIERGRLINALARLQSPAKWLQAPSGTGKSTLAASYARKGKAPLIWYRLDERDNDPAFFYAEFAEAVRAGLRLGKGLPMFAGDDHDRQREFAQRFAAALSENLPTPTLIVLDDLQRVTTDEMQQALASLVTVTQSGSELLFVSQSTAPLAFFDAIATRQLGLLNDADLRFDADECKAMTAALRIDGKQSESITALTGGHAGALVLACELFRGTDPKSALGVATAERIHSHLLTKLVERIPHLRRELLLQTAFVPHLSRPIAEALAGIDAARELDALVESGLLRRVGGSGNAEMFEAHGLVRQGMQALARSQFGHAASQALAELTATVLTEHGQLDEAFALLAENASTARALTALEQLAQGYASQGQVDLLLTSIGKVPAPEVERSGWLCFWAGQALLRIDEEKARKWFSSAYSAFDYVADKRLAAASMVIAFGLEHADLRELESWIQRHRDAGGDNAVEPSTRFEPTLLMATVCAALMQGAYPEQINSHDVVSRLQHLLELDSVWLSDDQRVQAGRLLIEQARVLRREVEPLNAIVATRGLVLRGLGGCLHRGRWLISAAYANFEYGNASASLEYLQQAGVLAEQSNSMRLQFEFRFALANHWMKAQLLQQAADELNQLEHLAGAAPPAQRAEFARMKARLLLLQEQYTEGLRWAEDAMRLAVPAGFSGANLRRFDVELVYALAANDRLADALALIKQNDGVPIEAGISIACCLEFLLTGGTDLGLLGTGLKNAEQINFVNLLDRARKPLTQICEAALANSIEVEFVQRLVAVKKLRPSPLAGASWPWPVRVTTLGEFRLVINGRPYKPSHKAQDKPLELLKLLVSCQALGREFAEKSWIAERLWPDADEGSARKSLDMAISRLRKLLECDDAVVVKEGRLQLSRTQVWTDISPLLHAFAELRAAHDDHATGRSREAERSAASVKAVLSHYKGPFFGDEDGAPWLLAGRAAIAASVRHALTSADAALSGSADAELIPALQRTLMHDQASEDLVRSLMRAHMRRGQYSEALGVYRRVRDMLSLLMGLAPSAETEQIHKQALLQESLTSQ